MNLPLNSQRKLRLLGVKFLNVSYHLNYGCISTHLFLSPFVIEKGVLFSMPFFSSQLSLSHPLISSNQLLLGMCDSVEVND